MLVAPSATETDAAEEPGSVTHEYNEDTETAKLFKSAPELFAIESVYETNDPGTPDFAVESIVMLVGSSFIGAAITGRIELINQEKNIIVNTIRSIGDFFIMNSLLTLNLFPLHLGVSQKLFFSHNVPIQDINRMCGKLDHALVMADHNHSLP